MFWTAVVAFVALLFLCGLSAVVLYLLVEKSAPEEETVNDESTELPPLEAILPSPEPASPIMEASPQVVDGSMVHLKMDHESEDHDPVTEVLNEVLGGNSLEIVEDDDDDEPAILQEQNVTQEESSIV